MTEKQTRPLPANVFFTDSERTIMTDIDIELEFFDDLCERSRKQPDDISMAAKLIFELHCAIKDGRQIKPNYQQSLDQFLALNDVLNVQLIEWVPRVK